jgi:hypothetical protein
LAHEVPSAEPELSSARGALAGLVLLPGDGKTVGSEAEPETGQTVGNEAEPEPSCTYIIDGILGGEAPRRCVDVAALDEGPAGEALVSRDEARARRSKAGSSAGSGYS